MLPEDKGANSWIRMTDTVDACICIQFHSSYLFDTFCLEYFEATSLKLTAVVGLLCPLYVNEKHGSCTVQCILVFIYSIIHLHLYIYCIIAVAVAVYKLEEQLTMSTILLGVFMLMR